MDFQGTGRPLNNEGLDRCCDTLMVTAAEVWAVLTVETRGFGFLADRRPQILFERHIFRKLTEGKFDSVNANVSNSNPGGYAGGSGEYTRLETAMGLDREAALKSASWGISQVLGFNHVKAGFPTVDALVAAMVGNEESQLFAMANFIKGNGLDGALRHQDWVSFARGYNGKDFKRNEYDIRLAAAHAKWKTILPDLELRVAQVALMYLGIDPGLIDGLRGRRTRSALIEFQGRNDLSATGELDDATEARLLAEAFPTPPIAMG